MAQPFHFGGEVAGAKVAVLWANLVRVYALVAFETGY